MLKVSGHQNVTLKELKGFGHQMTNPAHPLLLNFIAQITHSKQHQQDDKNNR